MKIAFVSYGLNNGGAERVASILVNELSKEHEVLLVALYSNERQYKVSEKVNYKYIDICSSNKYLGMLKRNLCVRDAVSKFRADVVISFSVNEVLACLLSGFPMVYSFRSDPGSALTKKIDRWLHVFSYHRAKAIVFQTAGARDFFDTVIQSKGKIIGNPIVKGMPYWKDHEHTKRIITACRLSAEKNLPMLIKAFAKFNLKHPEYDLYIYGKGAEEKKLNTLIKELGMHNMIYMPGKTEAIYSKMAEASIFAITSDYEGLSNSMIEAMAIGIPVVCTDCPSGGPREYIENGHNGFLIPVGDVDRLADCFEWLADHKEEWDKISGHEIEIRERLCVESIVNQWKDILTAAISK